MKRRSSFLAMLGAWVLLGLGVTPQAHAQWAVIDVAAVQQLVSQISYWQQQIQAMQREYSQLQATHGALTGSRGMQALLPVSEAQRNYLPRDWAGVAQVLAGQSAQYSAMAAAVEAGVQGRAVLSAQRLAAMTAAERSSIEEERRAAMGLAVMTREAYAQAGARFASLAQLVQAVGTADDAKAIADLQGRIAAEQAMLGNEQAKLVVLAQVAEAERAVRDQQRRELAIAGHGQFQARLRPLLP
jgi:type IV secretion system protein VirB5